MPRTPSRSSGDRPRASAPPGGRRRSRQPRRRRSASPSARDEGLRRARLLVAVGGAAALGVLGAGVGAVLWGAGLLGEGGALPEEPGAVAVAAADLGPDAAGPAVAPAGPATDADASILLDPARPLAERRAAARRIAERRTGSALALLVEGARTAPPVLRAELALAMGATGLGDAVAPLERLLADGDAAVAEAAVRGLSLVGGARAGALLAALVTDATRPPPLRAAAARGLAGLPTDEAAPADAALDAVLTDPGAPPEVLAAALEATLVRHPTEIARRAGPWLDPARVPAERRSAALAALGNAGREAAPFVLGQLVREPDPAVRAAAARALTRMPPGVASPELLLSQLGKEDDAETRTWLYRALAADPRAPSEALFRVWREEPDAEVRLHTAAALAAAAASRGDARVRARFDEEVVRELLALGRAAGPAEALDPRVQRALLLAGTPRAEAALARTGDAARAATGAEGTVDGTMSGD